MTEREHLYIARMWSSSRPFKALFGTAAQDKTCAQSARPTARLPSDGRGGILMRPSAQSRLIGTCSELVPSAACASVQAAGAHNVSCRSTTSCSSRSGRLTVNSARRGKLFGGEMNAKPIVGISDCSRFSSARWNTG
jgi:hypothetical protein